MAKFEWNGLVSRIETAEQALSAISATSMCYFTYAVFMGVVGPLVGYYIGAWDVAVDALANSALLTIGAFFLHKFSSRAAAIILALVSVFAIVDKMANPQDYHGNTVGLSIILSLVGMRAVYATYRLRTFEAGSVKADSPVQVETQRESIVDRSKWNFLSSRIETTQQALSAIKVTSNVFFAVAVLAVMTVVFLVSSDYFKVAGEGTRQAAGLVLRSAAGIAIAAFLLRRFNSRVVAILFLTNAIIVGGTLLVVGGSIFIAFTIVFLWAAGRAVYATFRLQTILKEPVKIGNSA